MQEQIIAIIIWTLLMTANVIMLSYLIKINIETRQHRKEILDMDMAFLRDEHRRVMSE